MANVKEFVDIGVKLYGVREMFIQLATDRALKTLSAEEALVWVKEMEEGRDDARHSCSRPGGHPGPCVCHCGAVMVESEVKHA